MKTITTLFPGTPGHHPDDPAAQVDDPKGPQPRFDTGDRVQFTVDEGHMVTFHGTVFVATEQPVNGQFEYIVGDLVVAEGGPSKVDLVQFPHMYLAENRLTTYDPEAEENDGLCTASACRTCGYHRCTGHPTQSGKACGCSTCQALANSEPAKRVPPTLEERVAWLEKEHRSMSSLVRDLAEAYVILDSIKVACSGCGRIIHDGYGDAKNIRYVVCNCCQAGN